MPKEKYQANRNDDNNDENNQASDSSKKAANVIAKGAADYLTGGKGGAAVDMLANTKMGDQVLDKMGKEIEKNPLLKKAAEKLDDSGALDTADKALSALEGTNGGLEGQTPDLGNSLEKSTDEKDLLSSIGSIKQNNNNNIDSVNSDENKDEYESFSSSLFNSIGKKDDVGIKAIIRGYIISHLPLIIGIISFLTVILGLTYMITVDLDIQENSNGQCQYTQNVDESTKKDARYTTYVGSSLGGSIGDINQYVREGTVYYENGIAMWKGGTKSKLNGKVYGESGKNYIIVATATNYLVGNCATSGCSYKWQSDSKIKYFEYGDTFTIAISFDNNNTYKNYDAIVLDSCGACMEWSLSYPKSGLYAPKSTLEVNRCKKSEGYKIDIYRRSSNVKIPSDMGYIMAGSSSNICVGQVDLGTLVIGTDDTKLLQGKTISDLYGSNGDPLNNLIKSNVDKYGLGTGNGVAAAAITLINSLKDKGYRLPYYWAGGHGDAISSLGVNTNFGSKTSASCSATTCYYYKGFDCSGFVSWAVKNGACPNFSPITAASFKNLGNTESANKAKPGDVQASSNHVRLVVQNNNGNIILAESSGGTGGLHFSKYHSGESGYVFVDMSKYYSSSNCK